MFTILFTTLDVSSPGFASMCFVCFLDKSVECDNLTLFYIISTKQARLILIMEPVGALSISGGAHPLPPPRWQGGPEGGL